ncbi:MAG: FG-GAP repeat protein [Bacteroidetes bacterium]|nr:FG-GAP repeat protein [Bacteroidota bacterium]
MQGSAYLGSSVNTLGDANGDGYSDVIVGAYQYTNGQYDEGATYFITEHQQLNPIPVLNWNPTRFSMVWLCRFRTGDINNDGFDDAVVGAYFYDNEQVEQPLYIYLTLAI